MSLPPFFPPGSKRPAAAAAAADISRPATVANKRQAPSADTAASGPFTVCQRRKRLEPVQASHELHFPPRTTLFDRLSKTCVKNYEQPKDTKYDSDKGITFGSNQSSKDKKEVSRDQRIDEILSGLNVEQKQAVIAPLEGPLQIVAGPGTGKTKVITARVAYLILKHDVSPSEIIVTTFTKNAAKEMNDRLQKLLLDVKSSKPYRCVIDTSRLIIGTFHSVCLQILRKYGYLIDLKEFAIADTADSNGVLKEVLGQKAIILKLLVGQEQQPLNLTNEQIKSFRIRISNLKSKGMLPQDYRDSTKNHDTKLYAVYQAYQQELQKLKLLDFDDLLLYAYKTFEKFPYILNYLKHVCVDEFQDTNKIQLDLLYQFAKNTSNNNVTVVGDPDQSIYGFRNAVVQNFEFMATAFARQLKVVYLNENYRSTKDLLSFSESLMLQDQQRKHTKSLKPQSETSFPPVYKQFTNDVQEARFIGNDILYLLSFPNQPFKRSDIAVLIRSGYQSRKIEQALIERKIPYKINKGVSFWQRKEVALMLDYLRVVAFNEDRLALLRTLEFQADGLGAKTLEKFVDEFAKEDHKAKSAFDLISDIAAGRNKIKISLTVKNSLHKYLEMIFIARELLQGQDAKLADLEFKKKRYVDINDEPMPEDKTNLLYAFDYLYHESGLQEKYKDNQEAIMNHLELRNEIKRFNPVNFEEIREFVSNEKTGNYPPVPDSSSNGFSNVKGYNTDGVGGYDSTGDRHKALGTGLHYLQQFLDSVNMYATSAGENNDIESVEETTLDNSGVVTISTIHSAKGLEWPIVYIPGLNEGMLPSRFAIKETEEAEKIAAGNGNANDNHNGNGQTHDPINEERRIFYVATTRAKNLLMLSSYVSQFGSGFDNSSGASRYRPSRYLVDTNLSKDATVQHQKVFHDVDNLKKLYELRNVKWPANGERSMAGLISDYKKFSKHDQMVFHWNNFAFSDLRNAPVSNFKVGAEGSNVIGKTDSNKEKVAMPTLRNKHNAPQRTAKSTMPGFGIGSARDMLNQEVQYIRTQNQGVTKQSAMDLLMLQLNRTRRGSKKK